MSTSTLEVTTTALNLRAAPNTASPVVAVLRKSETCQTAGQAADGWQRVAYRGLDGYVSTRYVRVLAVGELPQAGFMQGVDAASPSASIDVERKERDTAQLHPRMRLALDQVMPLLAADNLPFRVYEAFRTPERQRWLYAQGRSRPGSIVTNAEPWTSFHQFGLAVDFVLFVDGKWSWSDAGALKNSWVRMRDISVQCGLRTLSWERPHAELPVALSDLQDLLPSGDAAWQDNLARAASRWRRAGGTGAPMLGGADRPALADLNS